MNNARQFIVLVIVFAFLVPVGARAQVHAGEPTMSETAQWFTTTFPSLSGGESIIDRVNLSDCTLNFRLRSNVLNGAFSIPLATVDTTSVRVSKFVNPNNNQYLVEIRTIGWMKTIVYGSHNAQDELTSSATVTADGEANAKRMVQAIRHAASLCGAKGSVF